MSNRTVELLGESLTLDADEAADLARWIVSTKCRRSAAVCHLRRLPDDVQVHILKKLSIRSRARLGQTCWALHALSMTPLSKCISLSTRGLIEKAPCYLRTQWRHDLPCIASVLADDRFSRLMHLQLLVNSAALSCYHPRRPVAAAQAAHCGGGKLALIGDYSRRTLLPSLVSACVECDPRICAAPSASLMRQLLPLFWAASSLTLRNMSNVGVSHFVGLRRCQRLRVLNFLNCKMSSPLCEQRRAIDGSLLVGLSELTTLTLDIRNIGRACRVVNQLSDGLLCRLPKLVDIGLTPGRYFTEDVLFKLLDHHPSLRRIRTNGLTYGGLKVLLGAGVVPNSSTIELCQWGGDGWH